jgi:hypothetical protein
MKLFSTGYLGRVKSSSTPVRMPTRRARASEFRAVIDRDCLRFAVPGDRPIERFKQPRVVVSRIAHSFRAVSKRFDE